MPKLTTGDIPIDAKALALARFHLAAFARRGAVIRQFRTLREIFRSLEAFWIIQEAILAHFEKRTLTQKDLTARATGTSSAATMSRSIRDVAREGWIVIETDKSDTRVRTIHATSRALEYYLSRVDDGWDEFWSIAEAALTEAGLEVTPIRWADASPSPPGTAGPSPHRSTGRLTMPTPPVTRPARAAAPNPAAAPAPRGAPDARTPTAAARPSRRPSP